MAIPKLKVTKRGARELSGPGEVIITKVGFGHNYETDVERASISGVTSIASFQPTVTQEGDYQIIDVTFDNENTGKSQYANTFIKTIAIIAKKGASGEEFILYGGSDLQGVHVQPNSFGAPHQLLQFVFKVRLSGDANITVQASELPGLATADSVNRVSESVNQVKKNNNELSDKVAKLKSNNLSEVLDVNSLSTTIGVQKLKDFSNRFGINTDGALVMKTCPAGTNFGQFISRDEIPVGFSIVKDSNPPAKELFVWKASSTYAYFFSPRHDGGFLVNSLRGGVLGTWRDLSQPIAPLVSTGQFAAYLRSSAVPVGSVPVKDSVSGAFGTVTKIDNNNVFFTGAMRKQGKTYQVAFAIVDGIVPSAFTEWALT